MVLFIVTFGSCLWGEMPLVIVVPSRWICKFLKPVSCSTLGLKGLIGSLKDLFAHMISDSGTQARGSANKLKTLPKVQDDACTVVSFESSGGKTTFGAQWAAPPPLGDEEKGSQYAVTESRGTVSLKEKGLFWLGVIKNAVSSWHGFNHPVCPPPHILKCVLEACVDVVRILLLWKVAVSLLHVHLKWLWRYWNDGQVLPRRCSLAFQRATLSLYFLGQEPSFFLWRSPWPQRNWLNITEPHVSIIRCLKGMTTSGDFTTWNF